MFEHRATTLFEDAIDVPIWLEADRQRPFAERQHRDREIGRALTPRSDGQRVRDWWSRIDRGSDEGPGRRLEQLRQALNVVVAGVGLLGGTGLALAAYRYDGTYPVNVVRVLGLLVAPQLGLLVLSLLLLPRRMPGLGRVQDALAAINPGALAATVYQQLARRREPAVLAWQAARSTAGRRFAKWQIVFWSQIAAVGFNVAAIATAAVLVAFTDLAFGWSTTLAVDAETATRLFGAIARPWETLVAGAAPDAALIERSQFFRLEGERDQLGVDARALTAWWSFTLLAIVVYGLLPRLLFLGLAGWRLRVATRGLLLEDARVTALLDRLSTPAIEMRGREQPAPAPQPAAVASPPGVALTGSVDAVIWARCVDAESATQVARRRFAVALDAIVEAGAGRSLETDRAALDAIGQANAVIVFVPSWEPPLLELGDFLAAVRERIGARRSIVVVPVGERGQPASAIERETWTRAVARFADAQLYVETGDS